MQKECNPGDRKCHPGQLRAILQRAAGEAKLRALALAHRGEEPRRLVNTAREPGTLAIMVDRYPKPIAAEIPTLRRPGYR